MDDGGTEENHGQQNLATHILQFFYCSIFFKFDYPCAFFLTKTTTSLQLNRLFWLGISMLHSYGFEVMLSCCDGASSNRSFILMNIQIQVHATTISLECRCFSFQIHHILLRNSETIFTVAVIRKTTNVIRERCFSRGNTFFGIIYMQCSHEKAKDTST